MKKLIVFSLLVCARGACAQVGAPQWTFKDRASVLPALQKTRGKLRPTYEVLTCAARQGYANASLDYYGRLVKGQEFRATPQDSAAFAFAYDLAGFTFRPWNWKKGASPQSSYSNAIQAAYFRDRARKLLPNSPEVLVMRSFYEATAEQEVGYKSALKATRLAPKWADARYWLCHAAVMYGSSFGGQSVNRPTEMRMGKIALEASTRAQALNASLRAPLYLPRLIAYGLVGDKTSAEMIPATLEAHLKAYPSYASWSESRNHETLSQLRNRWAQKAESIRKNQ